MYSTYFEYATDFPNCLALTQMTERMYANFMTKQTALARLAELGEQRRAHQSALDGLALPLKVAILDALAAGAGATEVAELSGLSRARIYQIRDGKR